MLRYTIFRLLQAIPVVLGTVFLIYALVFAMPGDPVQGMFGDRTPTQAQADAMRERYNLDGSLWDQYIGYLTNALQGDFGDSFSGRPVMEIFIDAFPVTLLLAVMAITIEVVLAVVVGMISAVRKGKLFDNVALITSLVLMSLPIFVIAFLAQFFIGVQWQIFPATVGGDVTVFKMLLPALVIGISGFATSMRLMRASAIETLNQDFVRTAYAKGLKRSRVMVVHVMRNSLMPMITNSGAALGVLMVGATVTEGIFNIPGIGNTLFMAIRGGERVTVVSFVTILVLLYVALNILIDYLYAVLDPRIRLA